MIDSYSFGKIIINGMPYSSDVILYPDKVNDTWWRKSGHLLHIEDLTEIVRFRPDVLIVGTGAHGLMKIPMETKKFIESKGIELIPQDTHKACKTYNELMIKKKVVAALHLTC